MDKNDVRIVNEFQESGRVFFHLKNGKTVVRIMERRDIMNVKRKNRDYQKRLEGFVDLFNEKYSEPQKIERIKLSPSEERFWELHSIRYVIGQLSPEQEEEYQNLLNETEIPED